MESSIIAIDDETVFLRSLKRGLLAAGLGNVHTESDPVQAVKLFRQGRIFDVALIDIRMPGMGGIEALEQIRTESPSTECIMMSAVNDVRTAVECIRGGAYDYLVKPFDREDLLATIRAALGKRCGICGPRPQGGDAGVAGRSQKAFRKIVASTHETRKVLREAELHAASDIPILVTGETGTGKELLARAIHDASPRAEGPYVPINMAALPSHLFDAEFFGHVKGAFTGADTDRKGYVESADKGTLVLDEIGTLPYELQSKLLRVLQDGEHLKIGSDKLHRMDIRVIAITNENLEKLVGEGKFRKDLYYRLKGAWLHLPPLRERREDVPELLETFLREWDRKGCKIRVAEDAMRMLLRYDYPGNIRELRSIAQSAINRADGEWITAEALPPHMIVSFFGSEGREVCSADGAARTLAKVEEAHIRRVYQESGCNKTKTARILGVAVNTLRSKLVAYGIE
jgi:two-component system response regulator AtoC